LFAREITKVLQKEKKPLKLNFPTGWIRPLASQYSRWPYLTAKRQRTLACTIQLCDVNKWNKDVWQIGLTAGAMLEWYYTVPVVALIETLIYEYGVQEAYFPTKTKAEKAINCFNSRGIINQGLRDALQELREYRNEIHLYLKDDVKMSDGKSTEYKKAVKALRELEEALKSDWESKPVSF
jgi:hypothetical protein